MCTCASIFNSILVPLLHNAGAFQFMMHFPVILCVLYRYDYIHYCTDISYFPRPRFVSEFGFQSYPSFSSMAKISTPAVS